MGTIWTLIEDKLDSEGISARKAARQLGISHVTLYRIRDGHSYSLDIAIKIANWLGVPVSELIDAEVDSMDALAMQIAAVLKQEPELAQVFGEAMQRIADGKMTNDQLRELTAYAAWRMKMWNTE